MEANNLKVMAGEVKSKQQVQKQGEKTTNYFPPFSTQKSLESDRRFNVEIPTNSLPNGGGAIKGIDEKRIKRLAKLYYSAKETQQKKRTTAVIFNTSLWNNSTGTTPAAGSASIYTHVPSDFTNLIRKRFEQIFEH